MTKTTSFLFAASLLFTFACDTGEDPVVEDRALEVDDAPDSVRPEHGHHGKRGDRSKFAAEKICSEIDCSDEQAAKISELFAGRHDSEGREAHKAARAEANAKIAAAFRADDFDPSVLERAKSEGHGARHDDKLALAAELHAILTPEQRATLADRIEAGGPMFLGHHGKRGHGKRHHGEHDGANADRDPAERIAKKVDRLCEKVSCTEQQRTQLSATFEGAHDERKADREARGERPEPDFSALAAAFRAESFDEAKVREVLAAGRAEHEAHKAAHAEQFGALVAEIHAILTPEQRATIAAQIEEHGIRAVVGGKGGKHGKHGKRGKHGKHGQHGEVDNRG